MDRQSEFDRRGFHRGGRYTMAASARAVGLRNDAGHRGALGEHPQARNREVAGSEEKRTNLGLRLCSYGVVVRAGFAGIVFFVRFGNAHVASRIDVELAIQMADLVL